ncbi:MAG: glycine cleavage system protein GcvH [Nitrososphaerota archaeon]|nr:glycine cleavage system protein GcvH [Nitrososphaerota archaeon]MDG6923140.1 glycine cleavage system protein GcvH [Nitrososphaerota archaeon]
MIPEGLLYTKEHEWIKQVGTSFLVGITEYAVKMLNDIVYVNLPQIGASLKSNDVFGQVESVKTVSDLYMPVSGKVLKVNSRLTQTPEVLGSSPYGDGWMLEISSDAFIEESKQLLNAKSYSDYIAEVKASE